MLNKNISGRIINISSDVAFDTSNSGSYYGASKAAVVSLTKTWALELAKNRILVNSIAPGPVMTDLLKDVSKEKVKSYIDKMPLHRLTEPSEIANAVIFLVSTEFIDGQTLLVDGGKDKTLIECSIWSFYITNYSAPL